MRLKYTFVFLFFIISATVNAQNVLKGSVFENATNNKLPNVFVRDNTSKQVTITDNNGNFQVRTETGHTLIFESPGYISDTLYVIDLTPKKIMLEPKTIALREVSISASRQAFDPKKEYPDVYQKSKVYVLSPSSWFGKENRDARRLKRYFRTEAEERHVDAVFTRAYVGSIVPLKGKDLEDFMTLYRPSYAFLRSNNSESLVAYINDSYKKFQTLPPEKRSLQRLTN